MSGFVKLDCGILRSTLWLDRDARDVFITALLLAEPREYREPVPQLEVNAIRETGWSAPPGWYGFVPAAGPGIVEAAKVERVAGIQALERLGSPEVDSRTSAHDGRRMIRIDGGYLVLNFQRYRDRDYTAAERQRRYRERFRNGSNAVTTPLVTQAEAEEEAEAEKKNQERARARDDRFESWWSAYPARRKTNKAKCWAKWQALQRAGKLPKLDAMLSKLEQQKRSRDWTKDGGDYIPGPLPYLNGMRWEDEVSDSGARPVETHARGTFHERGKLRPVNVVRPTIPPKPEAA